MTRGRLASSLASALIIPRTIGAFARQNRRPEERLLRVFFSRDVRQLLHRYRHGLRAVGEPSPGQLTRSLMAWLADHNPDLGVSLPYLAQEKFTARADEHHLRRL